MDNIEVGEEEAPAIKALGSLFKLTQVYLWGDSLIEKRQASEGIKKVASVGIGSGTIDGYCLAEDMELSKQLHELGLPLSFHTNKERKGNGKWKRNDMKKKHLLVREATQDNATTTIKVSEQEIVSPTSIHDNMSNSLGSMLCQSELSYCGTVVDDQEEHIPSTEEKYSTASASMLNSSAAEEHVAADRISAIHLNYVDECDSVNSTVLSEDCVKTEAVPVLADDEASAGSSIIHDHDYNNGDNIYGKSNYDSGDWTMYWDPHYSRNYFYNYKTQESTWDAPPGVEHWAFGDMTSESNEIAADIAAMDVSATVSSCYSEQSALLGSQSDLSLSEESRKDDRSIDRLCNEPLMEIEPAPNGENFITATAVIEPLDMARSNDDCSSHVSLEKLPISSPVNAPTIAVFEEFRCSEECAGSTDYTSNKLDIKHDTVSNRKKKVRRARLNRKFSGDNEELLSEGVSEELSLTVNKYWCQRYLLFSKYDDGIKMDEEGWFSVTPEPIAKHHASRCGGDVVVDCFTGVGGNAIQLAQTNIHVLAIDIDPKKIEYAQHNAAIYGVDHLIEFIRGDCFILAPKLKADTVFLSPPWGGPDYVKVKTFDIKSMLKPHDGHFLFNVAKQIAPRIVMFLPRNVDLNQLAELSLSSDPPWSLEVEENYLNGKLKAITAYFNNPVVRKTSSSI